MSALRHQCFPLPPLDSNCYLLWRPETGQGVVIDPGPGPDDVLVAMADRGLTITHILATHGHYDHIAGVNAMREATGASFCLHSADLDLAREPGPDVEWILGFVPAPIEPDTHLSDGQEIPLGHGALSVIATPGHTAGGVCFRLGNLLFSGDTLFAGSVGRTDLPGGDYETLRESLFKLLALPDEMVVLPGHGPETTLRYERSHNPFLLE